jgi:hypothetical protein
MKHGENMLDQAFKKLKPHEHPILHLTVDGSIKEKVSKHP